MGSFESSESISHCERWKLCYWMPCCLRQIATDFLRANHLPVTETIWIHALLSALTFFYVNHRTAKWLQIFASLPRHQIPYAEACSSLIQINPRRYQKQSLLLSQGSLR